MLGKITFHLAVSTFYYGIKVGFGVWIAFVMTVQLTDKLFSNRPLKLFLINTGYQLVLLPGDGSHCRQVGRRAIC
jgi:hypothetical protein